MVKEVVGIHGEVIAVVTHKDGSKSIHKGKNIVGDEGDIHYAQLIVSEAVTYDFDTIELGTAGNAPAKASVRSDMTSKVASSQLHVDGTYPTRDDADSDNTGAGVDIVSWRFSYSKGAFIGTAIDRGLITITSPGASEPVLTYFTFAASFPVTADDTLKVFVNHEQKGV